MKVKIGPYPKYRSVGRLEEWWFHWRYHPKYSADLEEEDKDWVDMLVLGFLELYQTLVLSPLNNLSRRRARKVDVRVDDYDVWNADHTLALIILPVLKKLKEVQHGMPDVDPEDAPKIGKGRVSKYGYDSKNEDRWNWVLDEMIWTFEQLVDDSGEKEKNYHDPYKPGEKVRRSFFRVQNPDGTETKRYILTEEQARKRGKFNRNKYNKYQERIANGLRLFGKYYRALWD